MSKVSKVVNLQAAQKLAEKAKKVEQEIATVETEMQQLQARLDALQDEAESLWASAGRALLSASATESKSAPAVTAEAKTAPKPVMNLTLPDDLKPGTLLTQVYLALQPGSEFTVAEMSNWLLSAHSNLARRYGEPKKLNPLVRQSIVRRPDLFQQVKSAAADQPIRYRRRVKRG